VYLVSIEGSVTKRWPLKRL